MKIIKIIAFIFFISFTFLSGLHAQNTLLNTNDLSNVNVDSYSDDQLAVMLKRARNSGISDTQLYQILSDKGLPATEISKLKNRIALLGGSGTPNMPVTDTSQNNNNNLSHAYDSSNNNIPVQKFASDDLIFGSELFTENSLIFEPNLNIAPPAGYMLGPGDEIVISVFGYSEQKYDLAVNVQGEIYVPNVGPILVNGLTIEQATEKIKLKLASTIYRAINSGQTKVQVTLGKIKSIRVTVIGQARKPGTYTVSSLTTLFNALYLCGGPTSMGSYRDIEVIRGNKSMAKADLYSFLVNGNQEDNIILQDGDIIRIPYYKTRVTISGKVKRPGKFELTDNETFNDLLTYCGGFSDDAYRGAVSVARLTDTEKKIIDLEATDYQNFKPNGSDAYEVRKLQDEFANRVIIDGSINRPGQYELNDSLTIKDLVQKAGGLKRDSYTKAITVFRYLANKTPVSVSINLDSVLQYNAPFYLQKDDSIYIHSIFEFHDHNSIIVEGNIRRPGQIPWRENLTLGDLLLAVGGLTESGDSSNIEILRRIKNVEVDVANHDESFIFNVDLRQEDQLPNLTKLEGNDIVIIKSLPGYTLQRSVLVEGEVKSPGRYGLKNSREKIRDIILKTGGLKASADSNSITIRRSSNSNLTREEREGLFQRVLDIDPDSLAQNQKVRDEIYKSYDLISVDLHTALTHPESPENLALEDGDILTVARSTNLVKISGEVYFPTITAYKSGKNLKYYIEQAGNFTAYARKSGALVIYPDGKASSVGHFLWFKSYPRIKPRSEIYVPQKKKSNRAPLSIGELALMVSALGIIVNVLKL